MWESHKVKYSVKSLMVVLSIRNCFQWVLHKMFWFCYRTKDNYTIIEYIPSPQVSLHEVGFHYSTFTSDRKTFQNMNETITIWAPGNKLRYYQFILFFGEAIIKHIHKYSMIKRPILKGPINIVAVPSDLNGYEIGSWNLLTNGWGLDNSLILEE